MSRKSQTLNLHYHINHFFGIPGLVNPLRRNSGLPKLFHWRVLSVADILRASKSFHFYYTRCMILSPISRFSIFFSRTFINVFQDSKYQNLNCGGPFFDIQFEMNSRLLKLPEASLNFAKNIFYSCMNFLLL